MAAKSYQQRQQMIDNATDTSTGQVGWNGTNGLANILSELNMSLKNNANLYYPDATALANAGFIDGGYAIIANEGILSFYKWFGVTDPDVVGGITSLAGGQWRPVFAVTLPVESPWKLNNGLDIVPQDALVTSPVAVGANAVTAGLIFEAFSTTKAMKIPTMTNTQLLALTPKVANSLVFGSECKMMLRYDLSQTAFKSAGALTYTLSGGATAGQTFIDVPFPSTMHTIAYNVFISPDNAYTATTLIGNYITARAANQFRINFPAAAGSGAISFSFLIVA